uniref:Transmembrane protein n=1 Tax=Lotharella oceanica TaxID=641309 RepID=A0A7S2XBQ2_9EUKA|mmetsp:Transcript_26659/g.49817  ORF Transcript_26659/g.49817 Transcript_26659/m.49817 type:complete len:254 (+) Transcript_26659:105-866(+)|eukprot:CAMPEP_0170178634 /NCGR_PEP_ID=MMETSP0040_2-20121228/12947_1 /TAXON_ID=641309 /ORGANISM="Lotharella oceanica, Strain CCMP622" /LENGTH=253 /DNA_ID=CAMNT_0010421917 /DNA_START=37 /DNA_END=798 /DNA_ORIENTATION=+
MSDGGKQTSRGRDMEKGKDPYEGGMDRGQMISMAVSVASGAVLGMVISFTVNCTLVEISVNAFFAVYFGVLFCLISGWMLYRVSTGEHPRPILLGSFSGLVMLAGLLCFFLESNWVVSLSRGAKVPLYSILGIAVTFALLFSIIDLVNYCYGSFSSVPGKALVETEMQVLLIVATATILGFLFGLVFGLLDVEDADYVNLRGALLQQERVCYPIGAVISAGAAAINQYLREKNSQEYQYESLRKDDVLDDDDF